VAKKRSAIILGELARESAAKLQSMVVELTGDTNEGSKPSHWSRRFAASGKMRPLKPLRMS